MAYYLNASVDSSRLKESTVTIFSIPEALIVSSILITFTSFCTTLSPVDGLLYACRASGLVEAQSEVLAVADFEDSKWIESSLHTLRRARL